MQIVCKQQNAPLTQQAREAIADSASMLSRQAGVVAAGANDIGTSGLNDFTKKLAHAALGCAGGAAMAGNSSGCSAGAVGAVVGEMAAEYATTTLKMNKTDALSFAKVLSAASGVITGGGGDNVAAVNVANTTGANAAENNYLKHTDLTKKQQELAECKDDDCRKQVNSYWTKVSQDRNTKTGDSIIAGKEAANLQTMDRLASDMSNLAQYKSGLESQLSGTSDPNQRASIQLQINEADNSMRQIASQGKDALALLYQQTGNPEYQNAFQALVASTGGNELSAAWGAGGIAGMSNKRVPKEVDAPLGGANGVTGAEESSIGARAVTIANENGPSATAPVGRGGNPMSVTPGTNAAAAIDGVNYSGHALDQMQGRGVVPSAVKSTIENGTTFPTGTGTAGYYDAATNLRVIVNSTNGRVVTVIPGKP